MKRAPEHIALRGVRTHNLKNVDCDIPHRQLTVVTGVSGSGKSSLAFDTLYAEGQRRYTESLSTYARQFLQRMEKPPLDAVHNIQPAVALRQKNEVSNARSTVGTVTEIDDHLQLLFTHAGQTICPNCELLVSRDTVASVVNTLNALEDGARLVIVATVDATLAEHRASMLKHLVQEGYARLYLDGETVDLREADFDRLLDRSDFPVVIDRVIVREDAQMRISEAVEAGLALGKGRILIYRAGEASAPMVFDQAFRCNTCSTNFVEPQPALFSFNSSLGACPECTGFGKTMGVDFKKVIPNPSLTIEGGVIACFQTPKYVRQQAALVKACMTAGIAIDVPFAKLAAEHQKFVRFGGKGYKGLSKFFDELKAKTFKTDVRIFLARYRGYDLCPSCEGSRLHPDARNVRVAGMLISDVWGMRIEQALAAFGDLRLPEHLGKRVQTLLDEILYRLNYLVEVGLGYLTIERQSRTLSGGEMQRIHLTSSLGRALTDTLYVLDEPTAGLHARDSQRLLEVLRGLRDLGNTVVVVEHDPEIILGADYILELGPLGGEHGGELMYSGPVGGFDLGRATEMAADLLDEGAKPTSDKWIRIFGASEHNLDNLDVAIPHNRMSVVTGVSGSGKSTLLEEVLYNSWRRSQGHGGIASGSFERLEGLEDFDHVVLMDQGAIGRSSRSNALSYTKGYDDIRKVFSQTREAQLTGLTMGDFSFNTPGGRCESCEGTGYNVVEMHFMADIEVVCEQCDGHRFTRKVLAVQYRGKNISDVFAMTVDEAVDFFASTPALIRKLAPLQEVGLGYLRLGQTTSTLSGGEAQRLKLATYIAEGRKSSESRPVLFIFDEPTVGLHLRDVAVLLGALRKLLEIGHTVIVIEHNTDFIARCDYVLDLGPGAGPYGGKLVACGTPAEVAACPESITGHYLRDLIGE
ncbi:MAG: excinuclease ABC subunit UvrA [Bradymonadaceae bacterium]|nr:excinuclease ABC subunit UvrA [Lujinxingiaceae bacterium]